MRADEFYPIFGHFWPFCRILCTLVHFGEQYGHFEVRLQMGNCSYQDTKRAQMRAYGSIFRQLAAWGTQICTRWGAPGGCPQNDRVLAKNAPKCTK